MKDAQGNKITTKEFMHRWKAGIEGVTPIQQTKGQINSTWIMILGMFFGIIVMAFNLKTFWWVEIILCAGLFNTLIQLLGLKQKLKLLKQFMIIPESVEQLKGGKKCLNF